MATRAQYSQRFDQDIHLYPLYMKLAADSFNAGKTREGMFFFKRDREGSGTFTSKVYEQMWKIKNPKKGDHLSNDSKYGEKSFHGIGGLSSTESQKAKAIYASLIGVDPEEIQMQENKISEILWKMHKRPLGDDKYGEHALHNSHGCYASDSDKGWALSQYLWDSRLLTWFSQDKEIRLVPSGKGLKLLGLDLSSGRTWEGPITLRVPVEECISQLAEFDVTFNGDTPDFSPLVEYKDWPSNFSFGGITVRVFRRGSELIWHAFENSSYPIKTASWIFADNDSKHALNYLGTIDPDKREAFVRGNFKFDMKFDSISRRLLSVSIKCGASLPSTVNSKEIEVPIKLTCAGQTFVGKTPFDLNSYSFPLYLYLAAKSFDNRKTAQGMKLFEYARGNPRTLQHNVYGKMWEIKCPKETDCDYNDSQYAEKCFHGVAGKDRLFSSDREKAQAIYRSLDEAAGSGALDWEWLQIQESEIYESLGKFPGVSTPGDLERGEKIFYDLNKYPDVSFEAKARAIDYKLPSRVFTFFSEDGVLSLLRSGDNLKYQAFNGASGKTWYGDFPCGDLSIENRVSSLAERILVFEDDSPHFYKLTPCKEWPNNAHNYSNDFPDSQLSYLFKKHKKINLSLIEDKHIWHVIDLTNQTSSWLSAGSDTRDMMERLSACPPHVQEINITKWCDIQMAFQSGSGKLVSASIKSRAIEPANTPKIESSQLDPSKIIDQDNWAITLVSHGESLTSRGYSLDPGFGHAEIIFEGVENGQYFVKCFHLTDAPGRNAKGETIKAPPGHARVAVDNYTIRRDKINVQSPTWRRPRASVEWLKGEKDKFYLFDLIGNPSYAPVFEFCAAGLEKMSQTIPYFLGERKKPWESPPPFGSERPKIGDWAMERRRNEVAVNGSYNCLTFAIKIMRGMGIALPMPDAFLASPTQYIKTLPSYGFIDNN